MFRRRLSCLALVCAAVVAAPLARADDGGLKGIERFQLFVTGLDKAPSRACGLEADELKAAFLSPLEAAGADVAPPSDGYWIALQATTARREPGTCATFVDASVLQNTRYRNRAADAELEGKVLLWTQGELVLSESRQHSAVVRDVFGKLGRQLAETWGGVSPSGQVN